MLMYEPKCVKWEFKQSIIITLKVFLLNTVQIIETMFYTAAKFLKTVSFYAFTLVISSVSRYITIAWCWINASYLHFSVAWFLDLIFKKKHSYTVAYSFNHILTAWSFFFWSWLQYFSIILKIARIDLDILSDGTWKLINY